MGIMVETRERVKQPSRKTCAYASKNSKNAQNSKPPESPLTFLFEDFRQKLDLSIIIISPGLDSRARTALEHMLESMVSARGKVLRTNFSATSRVTRATKLTQATSRHSYRWCSPPTRGSATTFAVGDGRCVTALKLGVSLFSPKWQRSS